MGIHFDGRIVLNIYFYIFTNKCISPFSNILDFAWTADPTYHLIGLPSIKGIQVSDFCMPQFNDIRWSFFYLFLKILSLTQMHLSVSFYNVYSKELSPCHKLWFYNPYIFGTHWRKPLIFQTYIIRSNRSHSLKCQMSTTLDSKDKGIRKSEFVTKTQFLYISPYTAHN